MQSLSRHSNLWPCCFQNGSYILSCNYWERGFSEFPCDFITLFVLCQVYALDIDAGVRESAIMLIQILRRQFLDDTLPSSQNDVPDNSLISPSAVSDSPHKKKRQTFPTNFEAISRDLSSNYTQLTMPVISELFCRLETARSNRQAAMLSILLQWIDHIELVDPFCDLFSSPETLGTSEKGWGSSEATQLLLNNMIYLTAKFSSEHCTEISTLWKSLAKGYPSNLSVILHALFVLVSLSPESFIPVAKHVAEYLLDSCGNHFMLVLMEQLINSGEQFKLTLVRSEIPPYYRWQPIQNENSETPQSIDQLAEHVSQKTGENRPANTEAGESDADPKNPKTDVKTKKPRQLPMPVSLEPARFKLILFLRPMGDIILTWVDSFRHQLNPLRISPDLTWPCFCWATWSVLTMEALIGRATFQYCWMCPLSV